MYYPLHSPGNDGTHLGGTIMWNFIVRRTFYSLLILLGVVLLTFLLFNVSAGDPSGAVLGKNARPAEVEALRRELGADLPLFYGRKCRTEAFEAKTLKRQFEVAVPVICCYEFQGKTIQHPVDAAQDAVKLPAGAEKVTFYRLQDNPWNSQFFRALKELISFDTRYPYIRVLDFGRTLTTGEKISDILRRGVGPSLALMLPVFLGELFFGILFSLIATAFKDTIIDRTIVFLAVAGMSVSYLVVIIAAQWYLGYYCNLFPVWGYEGLASLGLPILVGTLCGIGSNIRFYRSVFANELRKEYLRTAAAKGVSPVGIYGKHLLRNAALQVITRAGASLPYLFTGSLLLESFFGIPGLGFAGVDALYNSDLQLLKALVIVSALLFVIMNFLTDIAYAWADPRIRLGK